MNYRNKKIGKNVDEDNEEKEISMPVDEYFELKYLGMPHPFDFNCYSSRTYKDNYIINNLTNYNHKPKIKSKVNKVLNDENFNEEGLTNGVGIDNNLNSFSKSTGNYINTYTVSFINNSALKAPNGTSIVRNNNNNNNISGLTNSSNYSAVSNIDKSTKSHKKYDEKINKLSVDNLKESHSKMNNNNLAKSTNNYINKNSIYKKNKVNSKSKYNKSQNKIQNKNQTQSKRFKKKENLNNFNKDSFSKKKINIETNNDYLHKDYLYNVITPSNNNYETQYDSNNYNNNIQKRKTTIEGLNPLETLNSMKIYNPTSYTTMNNIYNHTNIDQNIGNYTNNLQNVNMNGINFNNYNIGINNNNYILDNDKGYLTYTGSFRPNQIKVNMLDANNTNQNYSQNEKNESNIINNTKNITNNTNMSNCPSSGKKNLSKKKYFIETEFNNFNNNKNKPININNDVLCTTSNNFNSLNNYQSQNQSQNYSMSQNQLQRNNSVADNSEQRNKLNINIYTSPINSNSNYNCVYVKKNLGLSTPKNCIVRNYCDEMYLNCDSKEKDKENTNIYYNSRLSKDRRMTYNNYDRQRKYVGNEQFRYSEKNSNSISLRNHKNEGHSSFGVVLNQIQNQVNNVLGTYVNLIQQTMGNQKKENDNIIKSK